LDPRFSEKHHVKFHSLLAFLGRVPAIATNDTAWGGFGTGENPGGGWWIKLTIAIRHPLAWHTVQELAFVLNGVAVAEKLPTVFKPVSPPPYLNGGPDDYPSWVIETDDVEMRPGTVAKWLQSRLPDPVDDPAAWPD
jgi:hypothetical protein